MQAFHILFNNNKEAYDNMELKDQINHQYEVIQKAEPSYSTMEMDEDEEEYNLPTGRDWHSMYENIYDEYLLYAGNGGRFLKSL